MKKVLDKDLEKAIAAIIKSDSKKPATEIVELLRKTQDAGGMKVCMVKNWE
jgi:hypothetical protein